MIVIQLNQRQQKIIEIVKENEPITSEQIASMLNVTRATLRSDLAILTMSIPVIAKKDDSLYEVIVNMFLSDVGSIFIIDDDENLCGIVSRKDLLKATIGGADMNKMPIGMIMTRTPNIITVEKEDSVIIVAKKIIEHEIDSIPVVENLDDNRCKIVGKISKTNITKLFLEMVDN